MLLEQEQEQDSEPLSLFVDLVVSSPPIPENRRICTSSSSVAYNLKRVVKITKEKYEKLEKYKTMLQGLESLLKNQRYTVSPESRQLWYTFLAFCPMSLCYLELIAATTIRSFLYDAKTDLNIPNLITCISKRCTPSQAVICSFIHEDAIEKLAVLRRKVEGKNFT